jgi:hypothetical protein
VLFLFWAKIGSMLKSFSVNYTEFENLVFLAAGKKKQKSSTED